MKFKHKLLFLSFFSPNFGFSIDQTNRLESSCLGVLFDMNKVLFMSIDHIGAFIYVGENNMFLASLLIFKKNLP